MENLKSFFNKVICFLKESKQRLKLASPKYFKKIRSLCAGSGVAGIFLKTQDIDFVLFKHSDKDVSVVTLLIGFAAAGIFMSYLTVDHKELDKEVLKRAGLDVSDADDIITSDDKSCEKPK